MGVRICFPNCICQLLRGLANRVSDEFTPETGSHWFGETQTPVQVCPHTSGRIRWPGVSSICSLETNRSGYVSISDMISFFMSCEGARLIYRAEHIFSN